MKMEMTVRRGLGGCKGAWEGAKEILPAVRHVP